MSEEAAGGIKQDETPTDTPSTEPFVSDDSIVLDAFADVKGAILSRRTDIVREMLSTAQSMRDDDGFDSDGEEQAKKIILQKFDSEEYIDLLSLLLKHTDTDSGTLLHYATRVDSADLVRTLLAVGSNCSLKNFSGLNAYSYCNSDSVRQAFVGDFLHAVSQSRVHRIKQFLEAGLDVNSHDGALTKNTVLHWAVSYGDLATVKLLLDNGAKVNATNDDGLTPIYDGVKRDDHEIVKELLDRGANKNIKPYKGPLEGKQIDDMTLDDGMKEILNSTSHGKMVNGEADDSYILCNGIDEDDTHGPKNTLNSSHVIETCLVHPKILPETVEIDSNCKYLCPLPQRMKQFKGLYFVPMDDIKLILTGSKETFGMQDIVNLFTDQFKRIGANLVPSYGKENFGQSTKQTCIQCMIKRKSFLRKEEYKIQITTHKRNLAFSALQILLVSSCNASFYYGLCTLLQLFKLFRGKGIPLLQITDWPRARHRSVSFDFKDNDVPNLELWYETVNLLSVFKVNQIQLNLKHLSTPIKNDFYQLQNYCHKRFIDLVPLVKIRDDWLRNDNNNGSFLLDTQKLTEDLQNFVNLKYIHANLEKVSQPSVVWQLQNFCSSHDYFLQVTVDDVEVPLDNLPSLLNDFAFTSVTSQLDAGTSERKEAEDLGLQVVISYENDIINRIYPSLPKYVDPLYEILSKYENEALFGVCVKYSPILKRICNFTGSLPYLVVTSSLSWNSSKIDESYMENVINYFIYEDNKDVIGHVIVDMGDKLPTTNEISVFDHLLSFSPLNELPLTAEKIHRVCRAIKQNKQQLVQSAIQSPFTSIIMEETNLHLNMLFFLARITYCLLNLQEKMDAPTLRDIAEVQKSDNSNKLMSIIVEYERHCQKYYNLSTNNDYASVTLLKELLRKLLPAHTPPSSPGLVGVFNI